MSLEIKKEIFTPPRLDIATEQGPLAIATDHSLLAQKPGEQSYPSIERSQDGDPDQLGYDHKAIQKAINYASQIFPETNLSLLSFDGSTAIVLQDDQDRAYKVLRSADDYDYIEHEVAAAHYLADLGLAPKPIILVDSAMKYRSVFKGSKPRPYFSDIPFQRVETEGRYPIIVMEKLDCEDLDEVDGSKLGLDKMTTEFDRILNIVIKHDLTPRDVEAVLDKASGEIKFVDVGGFMRKRQHGNKVGKQALSEVVDFKDYDPEIVRMLLNAFTNKPGHWHGQPEEVSKILQTEGMDGIHRLLAASRA